MTERGIVIVGAGEAGTRAAIALRDAGFAGPVTLIGDELHVPYERPPLSKAAMLGEAEPPLPAIVDAANLSERGIVRLPGVAVIAIDRAAHRVTTSDGRTIGYDRLCLATGAKPRRLAIQGADSSLYLRTFDDACVLRGRFVPGGRIVIIGGGFIGLELAASARQCGCIVTVVEMAPRILMRGVPAEIAEVVAARHRAAGVELLTGAAIEAIGRKPEATSIRLAGGPEIQADCIIAGIGAVPETTLASMVELATDNGIAVDGQLRTSDPDIFGAGDCVSFPHPLYGGRRVRLEAWRNAQDQGTFVASSMIGSRADYAAMPWFWSDQYDLHLQISGLVDEGRITVVRDLGDGARLLFHLDADGRLVAASGVGPLGRIAKEVRLAEMLIARRARPDPQSLASAATKLKTLLAA